MIFEILLNGMLSGCCWSTQAPSTDSSSTVHSGPIDPIREPMTNHQLLKEIRTMNRLLIQQQQQQPQTNDQQQPDSMPFSNISNIISASSHLLPPPSTAITSASTSENKPKSNAGRPPFPRDENGNIIRPVSTKKSR